MPRPPLRLLLLSSSALCIAAGLATLVVALLCMTQTAGIEADQCELWLLGPFLALPLGLGLGLIGRVAGRIAPTQDIEPPQSQAQSLAESQGCDQREET